MHLRKITKQQRKFVKSNSISERLKCIICTEPFLEPQRLFCGHTFCSDCIYKWFETNNRCPVCRAEVERRRIGNDLLADNIINELEVFCSNQDCSWRGELLGLVMHLQFQCLFNSTQKKITKNVNKNGSTIVDEEVQEKINENINKGCLLSRVMMKDVKRQNLDVARKIINKEVSETNASNSQKMMKKNNTSIEATKKTDSFDYLLELYQ